MRDRIRRPFAAPEGSVRLRYVHLPYTRVYRGTKVTQESISVKPRRPVRTRTRVVVAGHKGDLDEPRSWLVGGHLESLHWLSCDLCDQVEVSIDVRLIQNMILNQPHMA